ncbi:MAG: hypothetical protein AABZ55_10605 [Bdellovibrionota bacterium]
MLAQAVGKDIKGKLSVVLYLISVPLALGVPIAGFGIYVLVAAIWIVPDKRIEKIMGSK